MGDLNASPDSEPITFLQDKWQILSNPKQPNITHLSTHAQQSITYWDILPKDRPMQNTGLR